MIRLSKTRTLDNYFIDENAVITDINGNVQKQNTNVDGRPVFKGFFIHRIMMYTFYGYKELDIHHMDRDKQNNKLSNLIYLTKSEHMSLHRIKTSPWNKGLKTPDEVKLKISKNHADVNGKNNPMFGKTRITNGFINRIISSSDEIPEGFRKGLTRHKRCFVNK